MRGPGAILGRLLLVLPVVANRASSESSAFFGLLPVVANRASTKPSAFITLAHDAHQELGTERGGHAAFVHGAALQTTRARSGMLPFLAFGMGKNIMKLCAACVCFAILAKMLGGMNCDSKKCDIRRCKCIASMLQSTGCDEFEGFEIIVTVHSVQDIKKDGFLGDKEFCAKICFKWSKLETAPTKDMRWEQTKRLEVPQGASECDIAVYQCGKWKDSKVGGVELETKRDMIDKNENFWGQKQKLKLEHKGKVIGVLLVTFRRVGGDGDGEGDGGDVGSVPIDGIDEGSALAVELMDAMKELSSTPGFVMPKGKWEGDLKVALLAKVLTGPLREVSHKGKEKGLLFVRVIKCNFAELLPDEDQAEELARQKEKAKKKGLSSLEQKWYWCWYENKKASEKNNGRNVDGFIPMASISNVHRSPERNDQFAIKYAGEEKKEYLFYRREAGKGLDLWIEGIDLCFNEIRKEIKSKKKEADQSEEAMKRMRLMHQKWEQSYGMPQNQEQWTKWYNWFKESNYDEKLIKQLYQEQMSRARKSTKNPKTPRQVL